MNEKLIEQVYGREILDSRGYPTVEAEVKLRGGAIGRAAVPSGASKGSREAVELRDRDPSRYFGLGVLTAVRNINTEIRDKIVGLDCTDQRGIDQLLVDLDGTPNKRSLGANAILAVSLAVCHAAAAEAQTSLYRYIREHLTPRLTNVKQFLLPVPMLNFINGGAHADNALDFQEFMLVPRAPTFEKALEWASDVYLCLLDELRGDTGLQLRRGHNLGKQVFSFGVGDEGGFSIRPGANARPAEMVKGVLTLLEEYVRKAGHTVGIDGDFAFALDPAASEFYHGNRYVLGTRQNGYTPEQWESQKLVDFYDELTREYPIISIEDGMAENDAEGWTLLTDRLRNRCQLVGDDLFTTNPALLREGIRARIGNAVLVKVNQIGTLSEALEVVSIAQENDYAAIISHRSGETEDTTISDIAVAVNAGQIKSGCLSRADRVAKYNRLLEISDELGTEGYFLGSMPKRATRAA